MMKRTAAPRSALGALSGAVLLALNACALPTDASHLQIPAAVQIVQGDVIEVGGIGFVLNLTANVVSHQGMVMAGHPTVWVSHDPSILEPLGGSSFRVLRNGEVRVRVSVDRVAPVGVSHDDHLAGGIEAEALVVIRQRPSQIILVIDDGVFWALDQGKRLVAHVLDSGGVELEGYAPITWSSSNPAVIVIGEDGIAHAVGDGVAEVVATIDGVTASTTIRVSASIPISACVRHALAPAGVCTSTRVTVRKRSGE
jgi:hypothetical protein